MKFVTKLSLPDPGSLREQLTLRVDPRFAAAVVEAERRLRDVRAQLQQAEADVEQLPVAVAAGHATREALEAALRVQRSTALLIQPAERAVDDARREQARAEIAAREEICRAADRFRDELQAQADLLEPALLALREAERELDAAVLPLVSGVQLATSATLWEHRYGVPGVVWPLTSSADVQLGTATVGLNAAVARASAAAVE